MVWAVSLSTIALICDCLTPGYRQIGIGGLIEFGKLTPPTAPTGDHIEGGLHMGMNPWEIKLDEGDYCHQEPNGDLL